MRPAPARRVPLPENLCPSDATAAADDSSWWCRKPFYRCLKTQRFVKAGREWRLGAIAGAPTHWWGSTSLLRPAISVSDKYIELKKEILVRLGLSPGLCSPATSTTGVQTPPPQPEPKPPSYPSAQYWLLDGEPTAAQIAEHVVVNRLLRALPRTHSQAVGMWKPRHHWRTCRGHGVADAAQHRDAGEQHRRSPEGGQEHARRKAPFNQ